MGRIYLLAYGLGVPVNNARSTVIFLLSSGIL
jgi:hypothetical protein